MGTQCVSQKVAVDEKITKKSWFSDILTEFLQCTLTQIGALIDCSQNEPYSPQRLHYVATGLNDSIMTDSSMGTESSVCNSKHDD